MRAGDPIEPHRHSVTRHMELCLGDGKFTEVEYRGREHRACAAIANAFDKMIERAGATRSNDWNPNCICDGASQSKIEAAFGAVAIH